MGWMLWACMRILFCVDIQNISMQKHIWDEMQWPCMSVFLWIYKLRSISYTHKMGSMQWACMWICLCGYTKHFNTCIYKMGWNVVGMYVNLFVQIYNTFQHAHIYKMGWMQWPHMWVCVLGICSQTRPNNLCIRRSVTRHSKFGSQCTGLCTQSMLGYECLAITFECFSHKILYPIHDYRVSTGLIVHVSTCIQMRTRWSLAYWMDAYYLSAPKCTCIHMHTDENQMMSTCIQMMNTRWWALAYRWWAPDDESHIHTDGAVCWRHLSVRQRHACVYV
jgi:hypothetical protein